MVNEARSSVSFKVSLLRHVEHIPFLIHLHFLLDRIRSRHDLPVMRLRRKERLETDRRDREL